ncbi:MAG: inositol monophosphatase family protein [Acidobacteriota bacterium]
MQDPSPFLDFAMRLADQAATEIMTRFRVTPVETKEDGSEVTEADRRAEAVMREQIQLRYPAHGVLGEEEGETKSGTEYLWVLDPIDGTTWFTLGVPKFGTLIALLHDRQPILGVVHLPATRETLYAEPGKGCWYRGHDRVDRRVCVDRGVERIEDAFVSSSGVHQSEISPGAGPGPFELTNIIRKAKKFRFVGDCVQHMLVARGMLHAALDPLMQPWDSAALVPCLREAGATVTTMEGEADDVVFGRSLICACTAKLHEALIRQLNARRK